MSFLINPYWAGVADPNAAYRIFGLHFEGADGSTTFTEVGGRTATVGGNAQIDTAQFKYGSASGEFDGTGDYVTFPSDGPLQLGANDFSIRAFFRTSDTTAAYRWIVAKGASGNASAGTYTWGIGISPTHKLYAFVSFNSTLSSFVDAVSISNVNDGNWHHAHWGRQGSTFYLHLDGVHEAASSGTSSSSVWGTSTVVSLGGSYNGTTGLIDQFFNGHIDEVEILKGICAGATVPSGPF